MTSMGSQLTEIKIYLMGTLFKELSLTIPCDPYQVCQNEAAHSVVFVSKWFCERRITLFAILKGVFSFQYHYFSRK